MMEPHSKELHDMALAHFNEPMLVSHQLARCIGYAETAIDCYIIARLPGSYMQDGKTIWCTCVGGYTFLDRLRGQGYVKSTGGEDWDDLTRLDSSLGYNGAPRAEQFLVELKRDDWEGCRAQCGNGEIDERRQDTAPAVCVV